MQTVIIRTAVKKEGIVIRPTEPVFSSSIGAELSMKVVSNKYLLKNDNGVYLLSFPENEVIIA